TQQPAAPVLGFLSSASLREPYTRFLAAFCQGFSESGYVEGRNLTIEFRWAEGRYARCRRLQPSWLRIRLYVGHVGDRVPRPRQTLASRLMEVGHAAATAATLRACNSPPTTSVS